MTTINFFAVVRTESGTREVRRLRLTTGTNDAVRALFDEQREAFLDPARVDTLPFDPDYAVESDELFRVRGFCLPEAFTPVLEADTTIPDVNPREVAEGTKAVFAAYRHERGKGVDLYFQRFDRRQILRRGGMLSLVLTDANVFNVVESTGLQLTSSLVAAHVEGDLYFRSAYQIRGFLDVAPLYEEATDGAVLKLGRQRLFAPIQGEELLRLCSGPEMRRRVTAVLGRGVVDSVSPRQVRTEASKYGVEVEVERVYGKERVVLPRNRRDFKTLLRFLNDDFLASSLTEGRYAVSSKRRLAKVADSRSVDSKAVETKVVETKAAPEEPKRVAAREGKLMD